MMLIGGKALAQKGLVSPVLSMQFSNVVIGLIGYVMYRRLVKR
jgi:lipopolysaccharide export LptBFGC system permease protein LptF